VVCAGVAEEAVISKTANKNIATRVTDEDIVSLLPKGVGTRGAEGQKIGAREAEHTLIGVAAGCDVVAGGLVLSGSLLLRNDEDVVAGVGIAVFAHVNEESTRRRRQEVYLRVGARSRVDQMPIRIANGKTCIPSREGAGFQLFEKESVPLAAL